MEPGTVKSEEVLRREWMNRPSHLMQYSLEEYAKLHESKLHEVVKQVLTEKIVEPLLKAGRVQHESGKMNGLEKKYAAHLDLRLLTGEIRAYQFEPMKLRLAKSTFFDIDFLLWMPDGSIELDETKGHWEDDARVKMKVAARMFPWWRFVGVQWSKNAKTWKFEEFKA